MRVHDKIDLGGARADTRELGQEPCARARHERAWLRSEPGVDEHRRTGTANQNRVDRQPPRLRRIQCGERLSDGREASLAVDEGQYLKSADSHSGSGFRPANPSPVRCQ
jgi:hypothetical protein